MIILVIGGYTMNQTNTDIFNDFDELDKLDDTYNYTFDNLKNLSEEIELQEELNSFETPLEKELNTTKDISLIKDEILDKLDKISNEPYLEINEEEIEEDNSMQMAFVYTFIIGFILLMICWGIYLYIITH